MKNIPQKIHCLRPLSEIESFYVKFNVNVVVVCHFEGTVFPDVLEKAINTEIKRHPLLSAHITEEEGAYYFYHSTLSNFQLTLIENIENKKNKSIQAFIRSALNTTLPIKNKLYDFIYITEEERSILISIIHHAVADGICCTELHKNIIQLCRYPEQVNPALPVMQTVEEYFPKSITRKDLDDFINAYQAKSENLHARVIEPHKNSDDSTPRVNYVQKIISPAQISELIKLCKINAVSLHGLICAAHLFALRKMLDRTAETLTLCFHSPMDIRSRLEPALSKEHMFAAAIGCTSCYELTSTMSIWELAKDINLTLKEYVDKNDIFKSLLTFNQTRLKFKIPSAIGISNVGVLDIPVDEKNITLDNIYFIPAYTLPMLGVTVSTFNQQLTLNYSFAEPFFTEAQLLTLADFALEMLKKLL